MNQGTVGISFGDEDDSNLRGDSGRRIGNFGIQPGG
ncbi:hypothetical protein SBA4_1910007 [Candidatus Sulfopaludibacter sp. SbA4]|nr:hypothetical protein SBA4_1910007 [Candidatus Sulfopaludibacter sp. SbA4]